MIRSNPERLIRDSIFRFVEKEVIPQAQQIDASGEFPMELFRKVGVMGVFGIRYPRNKGGSGGNTTLYCIIHEELARGLMSLAAVSAMQCLMGTNFLFHFGTEEMHEKYFLPAMRGEKIPCFCLTEPEAGSDLGAVTTLARRTRDGFVVNGMKTWVTNGPIADFYTVLCQTDPAKKLRGLNFFFIPRETPGVAVSPPFETLGTRTTRMSEVAFTDVHIPFEFMLGREGEGVNNLMSILSEIRTMTAALAIGLLRASMTDAVRYAKERVAFGRPIGQYQLIQAKVANMATELEAARLLEDARQKHAALLEDAKRLHEEARREADRPQHAGDGYAAEDEAGEDLAEAGVTAPAAANESVEADQRQQQRDVVGEREEERCHGGLSLRLSAQPHP